MKTLNFGKSGSSNDLDLTKGAADDTGSPTDHVHLNKALLDRLGTDVEGDLTLDGVPVDTTIPMRDVYDALDSTDATISLSANMGRVLDERVTQNTTDIGNNAAAITINAGNISDNTTDIGNNAAAITINAGNIQDNTDRLDVIEPLAHSHANKTILDGVLTNRIMTWQGKWENRAYLLDNLVRDGGWSMVANKDTADRAAPQPAGDPISDLPEEPGFTQNSNSGEVVSIHNYELTKGGWLQVLEVRVPEVGPNIRNSLVMSNLTDPANPIAERVALEGMRANEWNTVRVVNNAYNAGSKFKFELESQNIGAVSTVTGGWTFFGTDNNNPPGVSQWNITTQDNLMKIDKIDADLLDRETELLGIVAGSDIQFVSTLDTNRSVTYRVHVVRDDLAFVEYQVSKVTQGVAGVPLAGSQCTMNAEIPVAELTKYYEKPLNWAANPVDWAIVTGDLILDGVVQNLPDSAFGIRLTFQEAYISPDWDVIATSNVVGSGGGVVGGDMYKADYDADDNGRVDDSDLVNGLTVETAVPAGALFTDTVYDDTALAGRVTVNEADILDLQQGGGLPSGSYESNPTGLIDGGEVDISADGLNIEIVAGLGVIVDSYTNPQNAPVVQQLSWTLISEAFIAPSSAGQQRFLTISDGGVAGPVAGTNLGVLKQYAQPPTPEAVRDEVYLGYVIHNGLTWGDVSTPIVVNDAATTLAEFIKTVAGPTFLLAGGDAHEAATFTMSRDAGTVWELNRNWHTNKKDPHTEDFVAQPTVNFRYVNFDFSWVSGIETQIDPNQLDGLDGQPPSDVGFFGFSNVAIQRLYVDQRDNYWVLVGQNVHDNFGEAVSRIAVDSANTIVPALLKQSILLGYIVAERNQSNWAEEDARFVTATAGAGASGGGAGSVGTAWGGIQGTLSDQTDLQAALDAKVDDTQVLTDVPANALFTDTLYDDSAVTDHIANTSNPHSTNQADIGLSLVNNTSDAAKPISDATQIALDAHTVDINQNTSDIADLGSGKEDYLGVPAGNNWVLASDTLGNRQWFDASSLGVTSVNGLSGIVTLTTTEITEAVNLYFTNARADARVQAAIQDTVSSPTTLYSSQKIDAIVSGSLTYKGSWDATNNSPVLSDVTGTNGDFYKVEVGGTQDLGSGSITFNVGDDVIHNGAIFERFGSTSAVDSVNNKTGVVVLNTDDIAEGVTNLYYTDARVEAKFATFMDDNAISAQTGWSSFKIDAHVVQKIGEITYPVISVNGKQGAVVVNQADVGLANVNNTSDANKPISTATQNALNNKVENSDYATPTVGGTIKVRYDAGVLRITTDGTNP